MELIVRLLDYYHRLKVVRNNYLFIDKYLLLAMFALLIIGLIAVFSATITLSNNSHWGFFVKQLIHAGLGLFLAWFMFRHVTIRTLRDKSWIVFAITVFALLLVHVPGLGVATSKGASRWIDLGIATFQPVELTKFTVIVFVCSYCAKNRDEIKTFKGFALPLSFVFIADIFLMLQPDFGSAVLITGITLIILFMAGAGLIYFGLTIIGTVILGVIGIMYAPYRMQRLMSFSDPFSDPLGSGYHQTHSLMAFGKGGWTGSGIGQSVEKWSHLPEAHTDFIISVIAEETGVVGFFVVLILYGVCLIRAFEIASLAEANGRFFVAIMSRAIGLLLIIQTFINVGGNLSLLPVKGLTLPLISYGGSSLIVWLLSFAILQILAHEMNSQYGTNARRLATA